ncbi:MAG TPA: hypothetical protein ENJ30_08190 [Desulfobulbaceae bacterium]|nr:hypothetical protein [Desulfobulbaceae bacterium]
MASIAALESILASSNSEKMQLEAAKYILSTIDLAPAQAAFWFVGPTTAEEVESQEYMKEMRSRIDALSSEIC